jgi:hypothetical protein
MRARSIYVRLRWVLTDLTEVGRLQITPDNHPGWWRYRRTHYFGPYETTELGRPDVVIGARPADNPAASRFRLAIPFQSFYEVCT